MYRQDALYAALLALADAFEREAAAAAAPPPTAVDADCELGAAVLADDLTLLRAALERCAATASGGALEAARAARDRLAKREKKPRRARRRRWLPPSAQRAGRGAPIGRGRRVLIRRFRAVHPSMRCTYVKNKAGLTGQTVPGRRIPGHWPYPGPEELAETEPCVPGLIDVPFFVSFNTPHERVLWPSSAGMAAPTLACRGFGLPALLLGLAAGGGNGQTCAFSAAKRVERHGLNETSRYGDRDDGRK